MLESLGRGELAARRLHVKPIACPAAFWLSGSRVFLVRGEPDCEGYQAVCLCGCGSFLLLLDPANIERGELPQWVTPKQTLHVTLCLICAITTNVSSSHASILFTWFMLVWCFVDCIGAALHIWPIYLTDTPPFYSPIYRFMICQQPVYVLPSQTEQERWNWPESLLKNRRCNVSY